MKFLLLSVLSFSLLACNNSKEAEIQYLKNEVATLRQQMDSIINSRPLIMSSSTVEPVKKKKKKTAPLVNTAYTPPARRATRAESSYSGSCRATTKKGTSCSRKARSGGYCWQHGG